MCHRQETATKWYRVLAEVMHNENHGLSGDSEETDATVEMHNENHSFSCLNKERTCGCRQRHLVMRDDFDCYQTEFLLRRSTVIIGTVT